MTSGCAAGTMGFVMRFDFDIGLRPTLRLGAAIVVLSLASPAAAHAQGAPQQQRVQVTDAQAQSLGVRVAPPIASPTDRTMALPARVVIPTGQLWVVTAPVAGMVVDLSAARGDHVTRGQTLATLQSPNFVSLQREYLHAAAQEALAMQQMRRDELLVKDQALAERFLDATRTAARQASIAVAERRHMLRLSGMSDAEIARLTSEAAITARLVVAAPEDGTVTEVDVSPGMRLDQSAPLLKIAQLSPVWVEIAVPTSGIRAIHPGARVDVDGYDTPGRVVLVSETTDPATQTVMVRAEVPNTGALRPGQTAAARIGFLSAGQSAWEIPDTALVRRGEAASIFVAATGGFRVVPVTVLAEDQNHVVVSGAISGQDRIATSGVSGLRGILFGLGTAE